MDYSEVIEDYGLQELPSAQVRQVEKMIHDFMARCDGIAHGGRYLLIKGGNLAYYAGLEYDEPVLPGRGWTLYEADDENHAADILNHIESITAVA